MVAGGAGFIGSHLVDRLLAEGEDVDAVDDLSTGSLANLAEARASGGHLTIHTLDVTGAQADALIALRRPELVYHLALVPRGVPTAEACARSFAAAVGLLESARRHGVAKVVVALPASALYGHPAARDLPIKEGPIEPRGVRGVAARAIIDLLHVYRERHAVEFTALALAAVYGPRQRPDSGVVAAFHAHAAAGTAPEFHGDGRQTRDFVFVDDVVDALVRAGQRGGGLVVNIGTGTQTSLRDLWALMTGANGVAPRVGAPRSDSLARFAVSPLRARIHLGWSPWTDLDEGLRQLR